MIHQPNHPQKWRLAAAGIATAAVLFAAGCGGSDEAAADDPVIVVENATNTDTTTDDTNTEVGNLGTEEEQALAFADCMRAEGIDFPDPVVNADGSVEFFGANGDRDADGFAQDAGFEVAVDTCGSLIEGASFLPDEGDFTELEDSFLEVAECLRDNGIDVPDPQFGEGGPGAGGPFGADFDPDDPATAAAVEACQDILAGLDGAREGTN